MNSIVYLILVTVNIVIALTMRIYANPHKNIVFQTTLPKEHLQDNQVTLLRKQFKKRTLQLAGVFSFIELPILFIPYDSIALTLIFMSIFTFIGFVYFLYIRYIRKMTALKVAKNWLLPNAIKKIDTKLVLNKNQKLLSYFWFTPSIVILILGGILTRNDTNTFLLMGLGIIFTCLFVLLYYFVSRFPVRALTNDAKINRQVNDLTRYYWSFLVITFATIVNSMVFIPVIINLISYKVAIYVFHTYMIAIFLFIAYTFYCLYKMRTQQDQLIQQAKEYTYNNDDQYWQFGVYINPNDPRINVADRLGMNITINLGRPIGKIIAASILIMTIGLCSFSLAPLYAQDFSTNPFQLDITKNKVTLKAPFTQRKNIPIHDIQSVQLLEEMPKEQIRTNGTQTNNYLMGSYKVTGRNAYLLVYSQSKPILKIHTKNLDYYFTNKKESITKKQYQELKTIIE